MKPTKQQLTLSLWLLRHSDHLTRAMLLGLKPRQYRRRNLLRWSAAERAWFRRN